MPLRMHRTLSGPFHPLTSSLCKGGDVGTATW
jgi:hypothetical protein